MQRNDREWSSTRSCQSKLVFQDIFSTLTTEQKARVIGWPHRAQAEMRAMRVMSFQKCGQSFDSDGLQPQSDCLPVAVQLSRNRTHGEPLCRQFSCDDDAGSCIHVQSVLWTVGLLRRQCAFVLS